MIWGVSSWKEDSHEHLIFIILVSHLSIYLLFIRFGLHLLYLAYGLFLEWWMTCLATVLTWWIAIFQRLTRPKDWCLLPSAGVSK
jgi:hypothetical protein